MTTIQKTIITVLVAGAIGAGLYQTRQVSSLRAQVRALQEQHEQSAVLTNQVQILQRERDRARNQLAAIAEESASQKKAPNEMLKLRGEVGRLRKENTELGSSNALSKATANPEVTRLLRDQQKLGMTMIYKGFAQGAKLTPEQTEKLNDLLADQIMANVANVTTVLRDKPTPEQMNQVFANEDAVLQEKVEALLGPDGLAQYQDYTKNLITTLTVDQFKALWAGTDAEKAEKSRQISQAMKESVQAVLTNAGLPPDYQVVPILNFRNIASESEGEKSLKLLDDVYGSVAARASSFLSAEELAKFQQARSLAINNSRAALSLNRSIMAPISN